MAQLLVGGIIAVLVALVIQQLKHDGPRIAKFLVRCSAKAIPKSSRAHFLEQSLADIEQSGQVTLGLFAIGSGHAALNVTRGVRYRLRPRTAPIALEVTEVWLSFGGKAPGIECEIEHLRDAECERLIDRIRSRADYALITSPPKRLRIELPVTTSSSLLNAVAVSSTFVQWLAHQGVRLGLREEYLAELLFRNKITQAASVRSAVGVAVARDIATGDDLQALADRLGTVDPELRPNAFFALQSELPPEAFLQLCTASVTFSEKVAELRRQYRLATTGWPTDPSEFERERYEEAIDQYHREQLRLREPAIFE